MLSQQNYLVIVDDTSEHAQLDDYFSKFNFRIEYYTHPGQITDQCKSASALIINRVLINDDPQQIRALYRRFLLPVIVISNEPNPDACVHLLEAGADDFLLKPVNPRELHARISAISRRVQRHAQEAEQEKDVLLFAHWRLYPSSRQVFNAHHEELTLSAGEYDLLLAFVRQPQRVLARDFLLQITKSCNHNPLDRRIDVQISRLRQKIEQDARKPVLIKTIRNGGYLFTSPVITVRENS